MKTELVLYMNGDIMINNRLKKCWCVDRKCTSDCIMFNVYPVDNSKKCNKYDILCGEEIEIATDANIIDKRHDNKNT